MSFRKGQKVKQIVKAPITGVVDGFAVDGETGETQVRVAYSDGDEKHVRYFKSDELVNDAPSD